MDREEDRPRGEVLCEIGHLGPAPALETGGSRTALASRPRSPNDEKTWGTGVGKLKQLEPEEELGRGPTGCGVQRREVSRGVGEQVQAGKGEEGSGSDRILG